MDPIDFQKRIQTLSEYFSHIHTEVIGVPIVDSNLRFCNSIEKTFDVSNEILFQKRANLVRGAIRSIENELARGDFDQDIKQKAVFVKQILQVILEGRDPDLKNLRIIQETKAKVKEDDNARICQDILARYVAGEGFISYLDELRAKVYGNLLSLPQEILMLIFSHVDISNVLHIALVSKLFNNSINDRILLRRLIRQSFPLLCKCHLDIDPCDLVKKKAPYCTKNERV